MRSGRFRGFHTGSVHAFEASRPPSLRHILLVEFVGSLDAEVPGVEHVFLLLFKESAGVHVFSRHGVRLLHFSVCVFQRAPFIESLICRDVSF